MAGTGHGGFRSGPDHLAQQRVGGHTRLTAGRDPRRADLPGLPGLPGITLDPSGT